MVERGRGQKRSKCLKSQPLQLCLLRRVIVKKIGGFEVYSKQPVLSPTTDEATQAQVRAKKMGKRRDETKESSTFELLIYMQEIRDDIRGRDEQL